MMCQPIAINIDCCVVLLQFEKKKGGRGGRGCASVVVVLIKISEAKESRKTGGVEQNETVGRV